MKNLELAIIGSGPAGYTAGIYTSRSLIDTTLYTGSEIGGQLMYTSEVENFPGFQQGIVGPQLMMNMQEQAEKFETKIVPEIISAVDFSKRPFKLWVGFKESVQLQQFKQSSAKDYLKLAQIIKQSPPDVLAQAVIVCTGASSIMLNLENEQQLFGKGISVCAVCDAAFFKDKKVVVVGGGNSAMVDALALAKFTNQVTIIHRKDHFRASSIMQKRVLENKNISVLWNTEVVGLIGKDKLEAIEILTQGQKTTMSVHGLFLAIGHQPQSKVFQGQLQLDDHGFIVTSQSQSKFGLTLGQQRLNNHGLIEFPTMTSVEGVFAGGDVVDVRYQQASTAVGMGTAVALDVEQWLNQQK